MRAEAIKIFEEMTALTAGKNVQDCLAAYAELFIANVCCIRDSRDDALTVFRQMQPELEQSIADKFYDYHAQLDVAEPDLFARDEAETEPDLAEEKAAALPQEPLAGWARARALRDIADYFASCRDSGEQIAIGCIYPWMRDLTVETLRGVSEVLTVETVTAWDAELGIA